MVGQRGDIVGGGVEEEGVLQRLGCRHPVIVILDQKAPAQVSNLWRHLLHRRNKTRLRVAIGARLYLTLVV